MYNDPHSQQYIFFLLLAITVVVVVFQVLYLPVLLYGIEKLSTLLLTAKPILSVLS